MHVPEPVLSAAEIDGIVRDGVMERAALVRYLDSNLHLADPRAARVRRLVLRRELTHSELAGRAPVHVWPHPLGRTTALFEAPDGDEIHVAVPEGGQRVAAYVAQHQLWQALGQRTPALLVTGQADDHARHAEAWATRVAAAVAAARAGGVNQAAESDGVVLCFHGELNLRHALVRGEHGRRSVCERAAACLGQPVPDEPSPRAADDPAGRELDFWRLGQAAIYDALARGDGREARLAALYRGDGPAWDAHRDPLLDFGLSTCGRGLLVATGFTAGEQAGLLARALRQRLPVREILLTGSCGGLGADPGVAEVVLGTAVARAGQPVVALGAWPAVRLPRWVEERVHRRSGGIATVLTPAVETRAGLAHEAGRGVVAVECELAHMSEIMAGAVPVRAILGVVDRPLAGSTPAAPSDDVTPLWACAEWLAAYLSANLAE